MKYVSIILVCIIAFASCDSSKKGMNDTPQTTVQEGDTITIANKELEYEIIIIEPGFNSWMSTQQPMGFHSQQFLQSKNLLFVQEYNNRVRNPQRYNPNLYQQEINYEYGTDYGLEVNYLLYNYFVYFQRTYGQKFIGSRN